jgi:hypothetical protein
MTKYLNKKAILSTQLRAEEIEIEEWGGTALIQEPSAATARFLANLPEDHYRPAYWVVRCLVDENRTPLFSDSDVSALTEKSSTVIRWLVDEIIDRFGLTEKKARSQAKDAGTSD